MSGKKNFFRSKTPPIPTTDLYWAYSFRKLVTDYTGPCLRVKRSSDSTEQDINFLGNGELDTTSLLSFVGAGEGWITRWYDQTDFTVTRYAFPIGGNGYKIVVSGVLQTLNGKVTAVPDTGYYQLGRTSPNTDWAIFWVGKYDSGVQIFKVGSSGRRLFDNAGTTIRFRLDGSTATFTVSVDTTSQTISVASYDISADMQFIYEGTDYGTQPMAVVRDVNHILGGSKQMQELILYNSTKRTELTSINTSINNYYNSY
jgi:hypothetical protein